MAPGRIVSLTGVTGAGKKRLKSLLLAELHGARLIPSITARPPQATDVPGQYRYIGERRFAVLSRERKLAVLWRESYDGASYATEWKEISKILDTPDAIGIISLVPFAVQRLHDHIRRRMSGDLSQFIPFFIRTLDKETHRERIIDRDHTLEAFDRRWPEEKGWEAQVRRSVIGYTMIDNPNGNIDHAIAQIKDRLARP